MSPGPDRKAFLASILRLLEALDDSAIITITPSRGGSASFTLPSPPAPPTRQEGSNCRADILSVLRSEGRRLTTSQLLDVLEKRELIWGESTVKTKLAEMVDDGSLTNDQTARPRGYGLPEWSGQSGRGTADSG